MALAIAAMAMPNTAKAEVETYDFVTLAPEKNPETPYAYTSVLSTEGVEVQGPTSGRNVTVYPETATFCGMSLNGRFAFESDKYTLSAAQGLLVDKGVKNSTFAILNLHEGDQVYYEYNGTVEQQVVSGNVSYQKSDGTTVTLTILGKDNANVLSKASGNQSYTFTMMTDGAISIVTGTDFSTKIRKVVITPKADVVEEVIPNPTITIGETGYATFGYKAAVDISALSGSFKAYYASAFNEETYKLTMTEITDGIIPTGTGVMLYGTPGTYENVPVTETDKTISGNLLKAGTGATVKQNSNGGLTRRYMLTEVDGEVGFYYFDANRTVEWGTAYLELTFTEVPSESRSVTVSFEDDTATAIETDSYAADTQAGYYTIDGQRVSRPTKGLYVKRYADARVQGKNSKVIIK